MCQHRTVDQTVGPNRRATQVWPFVTKNMVGSKNSVRASLLHTQDTQQKHHTKNHTKTHHVHVLLHFVFFKSVIIFDFFPSTVVFVPHHKNPSLGKFRQVSGSIDGLTFAKGEGRTPWISCGFGDAQGELGST